MNKNNEERRKYGLTSSSKGQNLKFGDSVKFKDMMNKMRQERKEKNDKKREEFKKRWNAENPNNQITEEIPDRFLMSFHENKKTNKLVLSSYLEIKDGNIQRKPSDTSKFKSFGTHNFKFDTSKFKSFGTRKFKLDTSKFKSFTKKKNETNNSPINTVADDDFLNGGNIFSSSIFKFLLFIIIILLLVSWCKNHYGENFKSDKNSNKHLLSSE